MALREKRAAVVHCWGESDPAKRCEYGCLGCGACVSACRKDAIHLNDRGVAQVDRSSCIGCGLCAKACPQRIITLEPVRATIQVLCSNHDAGAVARKACPESCIACGACERACTSDAIHVIENCAAIDVENCIACGMCATKCPRGVIHDAHGLLAESF